VQPSVAAAGRLRTNLPRDLRVSLNSKPIVFLSHSSKDGSSLAKLKDLLVSYTGSSIAFFLSSDGESIPLGRNWVHEIQQALDSSKLMFAFVSPNSLHSSWLYFEAGYAYSKGIRVVPVGIAGVNLTDVPPPLSLLQGFNVKSEASLNNIIAVLNDEFGHSHAEAFTSADFDSLFAVSSAGVGGFAPRFAQLIESIGIVLPDQGEGALDLTEARLEAGGIDTTRQPHDISAFGLRVSLETSQTPHPLYFEFGGSTPPVVVPIISQCIGELLGSPQAALNVTVLLEDGFTLREGHHNITAQLYGSEVRLGPGRSLSYRNQLFTLDYSYNHLSTSMRRGAPLIRITSTPAGLPNLDLDGLFELLLQREVLISSSRAVWAG
jgi:hypothetical protein